MRTASQHGGASVLVIVLRQWQRRVVRQAVLQMRENWVVTCMQILLQGKFNQQSDAMRQEMQKQSGVLAVRQLVRRSHRVGALQSLLCWKLNAAEHVLLQTHDQLSTCQATQASTHTKLLSARHEQSELRKQSLKLEVGLGAAQSQSCKYQAKLRKMRELQDEKLKQEQCMNQLVPSAVRSTSEVDRFQSVSALQEHNRTLSVLYAEGEKRQLSLEAQLFEMTQAQGSAQAREQQQQEVVQDLEDRLQQLLEQEEQAMVVSLQKELFGLRRQQQQLQIVLFKTQNGIELTNSEAELTLTGIVSSVHARVEQYARQMDQTAAELQSLRDPVDSFVMTLRNTGSGMRQLASKLTECIQT